MSVYKYFPRWYYPISVTQNAEDSSHIPWDSAGDFFYLKSRDLARTKTVLPLKHIPVLSKVSIRNKTWFLKCRFNLGSEPFPINGLQLQIQMDRGSRITDDTVQLYLNNDLIGNNLATVEINPLKTYGNTWGLSWSQQEFQNLVGANFGVVLRFQSNLTTPHSTTPSIDFIRIRYTVEGEAPTNFQELRPNIGWSFSRPLPPKGEPGGVPEISDENEGGSTNPIPGPGDPVIVGSVGFIGSAGNFTGSAGFIGSTSGFAGSQFGFVGSSFFRITSYNVIPNIGFLPLTGSFQYQAFLIQNTQQLFYWDNGWILVASP